MLICSLIDDSHAPLKFCRQREALEEAADILECCRGYLERLLFMTVDLFKKHFRSVRLQRVSEDALHQNENSNDFKSFILVEGTIMEVKVHDGMFTELLVNDDLASLNIPVVIFNNEGYACNEKIMCVGFIHFNWLPDYRCSGFEPFDFALKAEIIKRRL